MFAELEDGKTVQAASGERRKIVKIDEESVYWRGKGNDDDILHIDTHLEFFHWYGNYTTEEEIDTACKRESIALIRRKMPKMTKVELDRAWRTIANLDAQITQRSSRSSQSTVAPLAGPHRWNGNEAPDTATPDTEVIGNFANECFEALP